MSRARLAMFVAFGAAGLALAVATATRDARLFLVGAIATAAAAAIWGPRLPLK